MISFRPPPLRMIEVITGHVSRSFPPASALCVMAAFWEVPRTGLLALGTAKTQELGCMGESKGAGWILSSPKLVFNPSWCFHGGTFSAPGRIGLSESHTFPSPCLGSGSWSRCPPSGWGSLWH